MKKIVILLFAIFALVLSAQVFAQDVLQSIEQPIFSDDFGPGVDMASVPAAKSRSAGAVYQVLTGSENPTEEIVSWVQKHGINSQKDGYSDVWTFDPMRPEAGWSRMATVQLEQGGPYEEKVMAAGLRLTNYLNYKATTQAMTFALPASGKGKPKAEAHKP